MRGHCKTCWECFPEVSDRGWDSSGSSNQKITIQMLTDQCLGLAFWQWEHPKPITSGLSQGSKSTSHCQHESASPAAAFPLLGTRCFPLETARRGQQHLTHSKTSCLCWRTESPGSRELSKARVWETPCPGLNRASPSIPAQGLLQLREKGGAQREQGVLCCQIHPSEEQNQVSGSSGEGYSCLSVPRQNYQAPG